MADLALCHHKLWTSSTKAVQLHGTVGALAAVAGGRACKSGSQIPHWCRQASDGEDHGGFRGGPWAVCSREQARQGSSSGAFSRRILVAHPIYPLCLYPRSPSVVLHAVFRRDTGLGLSMPKQSFVCFPPAQLASALALATMTARATARLASVCVELDLKAMRVTNVPLAISTIPSVNVSSQV